MQLKDTLEAQGERLFRLRSFLPLLFLIPLSIALVQAQWLESRYGDLVDDLFDYGCLALSSLGAGIRIFVAGTVPRRTSGRNTGKGQVADELNSSGAYSVVRHPLYLANFLVFLGIVSSPGVWWLPLVGTLAYSLYYERIILAEESFLRERFGSRFLEWAQRTPAVVPSIANWRRPDLPFCLRTAVKREYQSILSALACFAVLDYLEDFVAGGRHAVEWEPDTTIPFVSAFLACLVIRFVRKRTDMLSVPGR